MKLIKCIISLLIVGLIVTPAICLIPLGDSTVLEKIISTLNYIIVLMFAVVIINKFHKWFDSKIKEETK